MSESEAHVEHSEWGWHEEHKEEERGSVEKDNNPPTPPITPVQATPLTAPPTANAQTQNADGKGGRKAQRSQRVNVAAQSKANPGAKTAAADSTQAPPAGKKGKAAAGDDDEEVDEESDEPSKIMSGLLCAAEAVLSIIKGLFRLLRRVVGALGGILPLGSGVFMYLLSIYLVSTYLVEPTDQGYLPDLTERLRYVIRGHAWTLLPVVLGFLFGQWRSSDKHFRFARESFEQAVLLFLNTVVMATYVTADCFHWLWALMIVSVVFRFLYWIGLLYGGSLFRKASSGPALCTNVLMAFYNLLMVFGQDLGYIAMDQAAPVLQPEGGLGYWDYTSMCHLMEKVFCAVDDTTPRAIRFYSRY